MGVLHQSFWSQTLKKQSHLTVVFPDRIDNPGPYPVFYLLHGLGDDDTMWTRNTSLERYAARYPLIIVMPDAHRSFYTDSAAGLPYERYFIEDVVGTTDRLFHTRAERGSRCIGGLSMGGYGAVKLALKYPGMFVSATSHSGAFLADWSETRPELAAELTNVFGGPAIPDEESVFVLAQGIARREDIPALRLDCGSEDFLIERNRALHKHLVGLGIEHEYEESPGAHQWSYWDARIQEALTFHARHLGIEPEEPYVPIYVPQQNA